MLNIFLKPKNLNRDFLSMDLTEDFYEIIGSRKMSTIAPKQNTYLIGNNIYRIDATFVDINKGIACHSVHVIKRGHDNTALQNLYETVKRRRSKI